MPTSLRLQVSDRSEAGEARRAATSWANARGLTPELTAKVALVTTELGTNLAIHTRGGILLLRQLPGSKASGVEILSLDQGPGVANFSECLRDGYSTAGTSGIGLGSVKRASSVFEIHSQPGAGTALLSEIWPEDAPRDRRFQCGAASVAMKGEEACGDAWAALQTRSDRLRVIVADGLGHGLLAATASGQAMDVFNKNSHQSLPDLLSTIHAALRSTRGAAVAIAEIDTTRECVTYVGIRNISATIAHHDKRSSLVSLNGIVGVQFRTMQQFTYPWPRGAALVMHSDGLKTSWSTSAYPGLSERHASLIAGVLYRDFQRPNDDSTVGVFRVTP